MTKDEWTQYKLAKRLLKRARNLFRQAEAIGSMVLFRKAHVDLRSASAAMEGFQAPAWMHSQKMRVLKIKQHSYDNMKSPTALAFSGHGGRPGRFYGKGGRY